MTKYSYIYELEQDAQRLTQKREYLKSIAKHKESITAISRLIDELSGNDAISKEVVESLKIFQNQIETEIAKLEVFKSKPKYTAIMATSNNLNMIEADDDMKNKLMNFKLNEIQLSFLRNFNIDLNKLQKQKHYKVPFIDKNNIQQLEHSLQLINFSNLDHSKKEKERDLKIKNDYLTQLNRFYYTELKTCHNCLSEIIGALKDNEQDDEDSEENSPLNEPQESSSDKVIAELHKRLNSVEREKMQLEFQIIKLKERWNGLVESARKRKEVQIKDSTLD